MTTMMPGEWMSVALPVSFDRWEIDDFTSDLRGICGGFAVEPSKDHRDRIEGGLTNLRLGGYDTAIVALDADCVTRTQRQIRRDPGEYLFLLVQQQGQCVIDQGERTTLLAPGDMYLVDSTRPSRFVYSGARSVQISVHLPRDEALARFGQSCLGGVGVDRDDPLAFALKATVCKLLATDRQVAALLAEALMNLLGAYLRCADSHVADGERQHDRLLEEAFLLIDRRARDPAFDPAELTRILGVSPRTLQRRFEAVRETVSGRILDKRLARARSILMARSAVTHPQKIAAIAFECGFNDLSSFYRGFRRRFGVAPGHLSKISEAGSTDGLSPNAMPADAGCQD